MKILTSSQMRAADEFTIQTLKIPGVVLMENAGLAVFHALRSEFEGLRDRPAVILCGKGNNGGDGFVLARHLRNWGYPVRVVLLSRGEELGGDALTNYQALRNMEFPIEEAPDRKALERIKRSVGPADILIDAILGTGLTPPVRGYLADVIAWANELPNDVLAVDLPSGLSADTGDVTGPAIQASVTVTFAALKLCHVFAPAALQCGKVLVAAISIPPEVLGHPGNFLNWVEEQDVAGAFPSREPDTHTGHYGHALILAGSEGKTGAAVLAGAAALRTGSGLVTVAVPERCLPVVAAGRAEFMTEPLPETEIGSFGLKSLDRLERLLAGKTSVALGPGISTHPDTSELARQVVKRRSGPLVLDADGLNAFTLRADELKGSEDRPIVVTPHPGEMSRLCGLPTSEVVKDRAGAARRFSVDHGVLTVLKGMRTVTALPDGRVFVNSTGNPGMATGGTGDVLTGMIASLLGRGMPAADAAVAAVFLHGRAGDLAAADKGEESLTAGDLIEALPAAFASLHAEPGEEA